MIEGSVMDVYYDEIFKIINEIRETERENILKAARMVADQVKADKLVLLSDIDGLYTADPHKDPNAVLIPVVERITPEILCLAGGAGSSMGSGGMATKLKAATIATEAGIDMVIANGEAPEILYDLFDGKSVGTRFTGRGCCV